MSLHQPAEMCASLQVKVDMSFRLIGCLGNHKAKPQHADVLISGGEHGGNWIFSVFVS